MSLLVEFTKQATESQRRRSEEPESVQVNTGRILTVHPHKNGSDIRIDAGEGASQFGNRILVQETPAEVTRRINQTVAQFGTGNPTP